MSTKTTVTAALTPHLDLDLPTGLARVTVDPAATVATVTISTADDEGPAADAVRATRHQENADQLTVTVPAVQGGDVMITGENIVIQHIGRVVAGTTITGMVVKGNGNVVIGGSVRTGRSTSPVVADIVLPPNGALRFRTLIADLTAKGALLGLTVDSKAGDIRVESVEILAVETRAGDIRADRVGDSVQVTTSTGDVDIRAYEGGLGQITSRTGDVTVRAMPRSSGLLDISTVTGDIEVGGARHLQLRTRTRIGDVRDR
ncbi:DUF4097 family beta strand repeat-containing protein [Kitasatospora sp. NPDC004723]|uniref:DUF4097 family beta strand repeat-containing protein n=1 Tax=Kitasatospora sp. NPDC004723 TaxID=3154288 RepID=UPI0033AF652F